LEVEGMIKVVLDEGEKFMIIDLQTQNIETIQLTDKEALGQPVEAVQLAGSIAICYCSNF
jgi:predicted Fe-Mo cluster-binding NifX family protein